MSKRQHYEEDSSSKRIFKGSSPATILYITLKYDQREKYNVENILAVCAVQLANYARVGVSFQKYNNYTAFAKFKYTPNVNKIKFGFGEFVRCVDFLLIDSDTDLQMLETFMNMSKEFSFPSSQDVSKFNEYDVTPVCAIEQQTAAICIEDH